MSMNGPRLLCFGCGKETTAFKPVCDVCAGVDVAIPPACHLCAAGLERDKHGQHVTKAGGYAGWCEAEQAESINKKVSA